MSVVETRFWSKVDRSAGPESCWLWTGSLDTSGYGLFRLDGRLWKSHRLSVVLDGRDPGECVLHSCDVPACVNPSHLHSGTRADNAHDRDRKGRWVRGRGRSKLTDDQVREIRRRVPGPRGWQRELAGEFGITETQVSRLLLRRTYDHV